MQATIVVHKFPVGAWVRDPIHHRLSSGGIIHDGHGGVRFEPSGGEVVMLLGPKPWPAYKITFGECSNVIFADEAECHFCKSHDDDSHVVDCLAGPEGYLRRYPHEPGYAP